MPPSLSYTEGAILYTYSKFRCRNTKLPVETNTFYGNLGSDRCLLCPQDVVGDEFHYLFSCSYFGDERNLLLKPYYRVNPSTLKMEELFNESGSNKLNLCNMALIGDFVHLQNMNMKKGNETRHLLHLVGIKDIDHYPNYHKWWG